MQESFEALINHLEQEDARLAALIRAKIESELENDRESIQAGIWLYLKDEGRGDVDPEDIWAEEWVKPSESANAIFIEGLRYQVVDGEEIELLIPPDENSETGDHIIVDRLSQSKLLMAVGRGGELWRRG